MMIENADGEVAQFILAMDRVHDLILAGRDLIEVKALLRDARAHLPRAELAARTLGRLERYRLRTALPHLHTKLLQLEKISRWPGSVSADKT